MTLSYDMAGYYDIVLPPLLDIIFFSEMLKRPSRTDGETSNHSSWKVGVLESMREHMICCRAAAAPQPSRAIILVVPNSATGLQQLYSIILRGAHLNLKWAPSSSPAKLAWIQSIPGTDPGNCMFTLMSLDRPMFAHAAWGSCKTEIL